MKKTHQDLTRTVRTELVNTGFEDLTSFDENVQQFLDRDGQYFNSANNYKLATMATLDARVFAYEAAFPSVELKHCLTAEEVEYAQVLDRQQRNGPKFAVALGNLLPLNTIITKLDVSGNDFARKLKVGESGESDYHWEPDTSGIASFTQGLASCVSLRHLNLANNPLGDGSNALLEHALVKLVALVSLDLSKNALKAEGATMLAGVLPKLKYVVDNMIAAVHGPLLEKWAVHGPLLEKYVIYDGLCSSSGMSV